MADNRNVQLAVRDGQAMVDFLNREPKSAVAQFISFYVMAQSSDALHKRELMPALEETFFAMSTSRVATKIGENCFALPLMAQVRFTLTKQRVEPEVVASDDDLQLFRFAQLVSSGFITRVRWCPNCSKFWHCGYAEDSKRLARMDKGFCTDSCKVMFWQRTPKGRKHRRELMRRRRLEERKDEQSMHELGRHKPKRRIQR
jgi:hypothetical protein